MRAAVRIRVFVTVMAMIALACLVAAPGAHAVETTRTVIGRVIDGDTGLGVAGAQVRLYDATESLFDLHYTWETTTNASGYFRYELGLWEGEPMPAWKVRVDAHDKGYAGGWYNGYDKTTTMFESRADYSASNYWVMGRMKIRKAPRVAGTIYLNDGLPSDFANEYPWGGQVIAYAKNSTTDKWEKVDARYVEYGGVWNMCLKPATYRFKQTGPLYRGGVMDDFPAWYGGSDFVVSRIGLAKSLSISAPKSGVNFHLRKRFPTPWNSRVNRKIITPNGDGWADSLKVSYKLDRNATVTIKVINQSGTTVRYLKKSASQDSGTHTVSFTGKRYDGTYLPSGRYTIQIKASNSRGYGKVAKLPVFIARKLYRKYPEIKDPVTGAEVVPFVDESEEGLWPNKSKFWFWTKTDSYVTIWIYNKTGIVKKLKTNVWMSAGEKEFSWDSSALPSGTYYYFIMSSSGGATPSAPSWIGSFTK